MLLALTAELCRPLREDEGPTIQLRRDPVYSSVYARAIARPILRFSTTRAPPVLINRMWRQLDVLTEYQFAHRIFGAGTELSHSASRGLKRLQTNAANLLRKAGGILIRGKFCQPTCVPSGRRQ
jgi:hypothetical protein